MLGENDDFDMETYIRAYASEEDAAAWRAQQEAMVQ